MGRFTFQGFKFIIELLLLGKAFHQATFADPSSAVQHDKFVFFRTISIIKQFQFVFSAHKHDGPLMENQIIRKPKSLYFVCGFCQ